MSYDESKSSKAASAQAEQPEQQPNRSYRPVIRSLRTKRKAPAENEDCHITRVQNKRQQDITGCIMN
eukprot:3128170-Pleurochrysis_carterae.AAC.1